jgi:hypothetical protein
MDDKVRAQLQVELAPCSTQVFMDAYAAVRTAVEKSATVAAG